MSNHKTFQTITPLCLSVNDIKHLQILVSKLSLHVSPKFSPPNKVGWLIRGRTNNLLMQVSTKAVSTSPVVACTSSIFCQVNILWVVQLPETSMIFTFFLFTRNLNTYLYSEFMIVLITLGSKSSNTDLEQRLCCNKTLVNLAHQGRVTSLEVL